MWHRNQQYAQPEKQTKEPCIGIELESWDLIYGVSDNQNSGVLFLLKCHLMLIHIKCIVCVFFVMYPLIS